MYIIL